MNETNFSKRLQDASQDSDLYRAVMPMVSPDDSQTYGDSDKIKRLKEDVRKGLTGLEYLTGIKKNEGDTFYDEHPVQAVTTDVLGKSPMLGAGLAAAGIGTNLYRQAKNLKDTEMASMARKGNPEVDVSHPANLLDPASGKPMSAEHAKIFGDFEGDAAKRFKIVDRLSGLDSSDPGSFSAKYDILSQEKALLQERQARHIEHLVQSHAQAADPKKAQQIKAQIELLEKQYAKDLASTEGQLASLISEARQTPGYRNLENMTNVNESLLRAKQKGGLRSFVGEGIHDIKADNPVTRLLKKLAPSQGQAIADLVQKNNAGGIDAELLNRMAAQYFDDPAKARAFAQTTAKDIAAQQTTSPLMRSLKRHRLPIAAGAGLALGGTGLYHLIKAIQNQMYSDAQLKDWKKTLLKSRGEFDRAENIK